MKLRKAKENEVETLTNISKEAFNSDYLVGLEPDDGPPNYNDVSWHQKMCLDGHLFTYLDDDETIVGGAVLFKYEYSLYIGRIFIDPKHFRKGYGYSLMLDIEKHYKECNSFRLDTPKSNIRTNSLYKKLCYKVVDVTEDEVEYLKTK